MRFGQRRLIVHAGMPKTGSSTIQAFLLRNVDEFEALGISVLGVGKRSAQDVLANALNNLDGRGGPASIFSERGSVGDCLPRWNQFTSQILSMESLWAPGPMAVSALSDHAAAVDAQIEVLAFFRDPAKWLWSWWAQETKSAWIDWCAFVEKFVGGQYGFLSRTFSSWVAESPSALLKVRSYEGPNLVYRFLESISISSEGFQWDTPNMNVGEGRLEVIRRAGIVCEVWRLLLEQAVVRSEQIDVGLGSRLVLEATQNQAVGHESAMFHRSQFPDIDKDPTFNDQSHELIAQYAADWAADAELFIKKFGDHFDHESQAVVHEKISGARSLAVEFRTTGALQTSARFPRRDFVDTLPTNSWDIALARGVASAISGALLYIHGLKDLGGEG